MREVLTINVEITATQSVKGKTGVANMILFGGTCDCELFKGTILPGGVDTQTGWANAPYKLSARYILTGKDYTGKDCSIFIENNGVASEQDMVTTPRILTDSEALSFLETASLQGTISPTQKGVMIHIHEM